jgi:hypothetical protein
MKGLIYCSSDCMRVFLWGLEGSQRVPKVPKVPNGVPLGDLELMASVLGSTFGKEEVGVQVPPLASSLP